MVLVIIEGPILNSTSSAGDLVEKVPCSCRPPPRGGLTGGRGFVTVYQGLRTVL